MKELTKKDFESFLKQYKDLVLYDLSIDVQYGEFVSVKDVWENLPESMQWGVLVDYYDSCGIIIDVHPILGYDVEKYTSVHEWVSYVIELNKEPDMADEGLESKTRPEARKAALEKASSTREEQLTKQLK